MIGLGDVRFSLGFDSLNFDWIGYCFDKNYLMSYSDYNDCNFVHFCLIYY